ncbi:hypothetical protein UCDDS831_g01485 [Diplodia seriata]|uniref:DUF7371 domain-containing protein n=1 Tax=Diplodia seriata TaxID=420778 RepID=A0A0G2HD18_9PEZI|nr:hypothetical protein UCDDS831_g01485 [Diplodia seriata]
MCGEGCDFGNFTINFDEGHDNVVTTSDPFVGINNPTHHLVFNEGFAYVPTDYDAISPASPPYLVMYLPNRTTTAPEQPENGSTRNGSISADGNRISDSAFHFNAYGGSFSCNKGPIPVDNGPDPLNCTLEVTGFRWNAIDQVEGLHAISTFDMVPCSETTVDEEGKCQLTKIDFFSEGGDFTDLSSIRMRSYYWSDTAEDRVFFMDDLQLGWTNNNYTAGLTRGGGI